MYRVLAPGGVALIQDRTFADVQDKAPAFWIRTTLFELFPWLLQFEADRRPDRDGYTAVLRACGFRVVTSAFPETRRVYHSFETLESDILGRRGKSILFELDDNELRQYCAALRERFTRLPLIECDPWTVWRATR